MSHGWVPQETLIVPGGRLSTPTPDQKDPSIIKIPLRLLQPGTHASLDRYSGSGPSVAAAAAMARALVRHSTTEFSH
jgi:hypothetical protein